MTTKVCRNLSSSPLHHAVANVDRPKIYTIKYLKVQTLRSLNKATLIDIAITIIHL